MLNSGIKYEYKLNKQTTFTGQAGWANVFRTRMFRRKGDHELMDFGNSNGLYAKIGVIYRL